MIIGTFPKEPDEVVTPEFDYSDNLYGGTVTDAVFTVYNLNTGEAYSDMLDGSPTVSSPYVTQSLKEGLDGEVYVVRCKATMSGGQKIGASLYVPVNDLSGAS